MEQLRRKRLIARPLRAEDLEDIGLMHSDVEVMKFMGGIRTGEETKNWLQDNLDHWRTHGFGLWIFRHREETFVGRCGLRRV